MDFELTPQQKEVQQACREFARKKIAPRAAHIDEADEFPRDLFVEMGRLGYLGLTIPEDYGGLGLDFITATVAMEEIAWASAGLGLSWGAHSFLCAHNLYSLGNEAQRKKYLPRLCSGEWIGAFALTEPGAGSDSTNLATKAIQKDDHWILNGSKIFITNGSLANVILVFAATPRKPGSQGASLFIVDKDAPGFSVSRDIPKMGTRGSPLSELIFDNCRIRQENLIGKEGRGLSYMLKSLDAERALLSSIAIGGAQMGLDFALDYAKKRRQFGAPIASFQLVQEMLAQMATEIEAARLLVRQAAWRLDQKLNLNRQASIAKLFVSQMVMRVAQQAMQVLGGYGYCKEFPVERFMRDAALMSLGAGTSEIQKLIIARDLIKENGR